MIRNSYITKDTPHHEDSINERFRSVYKFNSQKYFFEIR